LSEVAMGLLHLLRIRPAAIAFKARRDPVMYHACLNAVEDVSHRAAP